MKLKDPEIIRDVLAKRGWLTIREAAEGLSVSANTIGRALRGEPVRAHTIRKLALAINKAPTDIATFVN